MTTERLEPISVGSCPTCGGPAQFITEGDAAAAGLTPVGSVGVREVKLPNIDEDLGDGWRLVVIERRAPNSWEARASRPHAPAVLTPLTHSHIYEFGFGDSPSAAYLALRSAIEARS